MDQEIKRKWIDALLSGEYKQGKHYLRRVDNTYCCLGVLCDLYAKERGIEWNPNRSEEFYYIHHSSTYLPPDIQEWAGLNAPGGWADFTDGDRSLTWMNDDGRPFEEIAKKIEEKL